MTIGPVDYPLTAFRPGLESLARSQALLMRAVESVADGDVVDAAISISEARNAAKCGVAVIRAADEMSRALLDLLA